VSPGDLPPVHTDVPSQRSSETSLPPSTATKIRETFSSGSQAVAACLITSTFKLVSLLITIYNFYVVFLVRALSISRSGLQKSDRVVDYLIRRIVLIGSFATLWVVGGFALWFFSPKTPTYMLLTATAGPVYTHVSSSFS
jgi:hypothetical protein